MYARGTKSVPGTNQKGMVGAWHELYRLLCMYGHTRSESMGKVAKPARGQLNKEKYYSPVRVRA